MKLGQILIDEGLIDSKQLKQALDAQLIYGGHLGTCLIELGLLNEAQLGPVLAACFNVSYAPPQAFEDVQRFVVASIPAALAEKHAAIPLELADKQLDVAMIDPRNLQAIDELSFASGFRVKPWVAPEARIFQALERYYGVPRRTRYVSLCNRLDRGDGAFEVERLERDISPSPSARRPTPVIERLSSPPFDYGETTAAVAAASASAPRGESGARVDPLAELAERMCRAEHRDQIARTVIAWSGRDLQRRVMFKIVQGEARVWTAAGGELDEGHLEHVAFDVMNEPTFALMAGNEVFCGPLEQRQHHGDFFAQLGIAPCSDALLVPVYLQDRLVAILYGDCGPDASIEIEPALYRRVARKIALGLNIDLLRSRLRTI